MSHFDHHRLREETVSHQIDNHKMSNLDISGTVLKKKALFGITLQEDSLSCRCL